MKYMRLLAHEIGLYPATLRFYYLVKTDGIWDYKNQPTHGASPAHNPFGNFNYGAAGTALGLDPYTLQNEAGRAQKPGSGGKGKTGRWGQPNSGTPPYGDRPVDNYWIKLGIQYAHQHGY
jgi:hypothetical protein